MSPDEIILRTLLFGIGVYGTFACGKTLYYGFSILKWPTSPGKITKSQIQIVEKKMPDSQITDVCEVQFQYEYQVAGKAFQSTRYTFDQKVVAYPLKAQRQSRRTHLNRAAQLLKAETFSQQYPLMASVPIHYHPQKPEIAYLKAGLSHFSSWVQTILGFLASFYIFVLLAFS
ncbi:MAG: DUF3592 domain-containing protein [Planctomycetota bacterium]